MTQREPDHRPDRKPGHEHAHDHWHDHMRDPAQVRAQYAQEDDLVTRQSVWQPGPDGRDASTTALDLVVDLSPGTLLEIGCGTGAFAARLVAALPQTRVVAIDQSVRFVELTAARGVIAEQADAVDLPFPDDTFDVVVAMWMLYHLPDLHRGLEEVQRVLRPGGTLLAVTNGDEHIADLRREAGGDALVTSFSAENAEVSLLAHFEHVTREDLHPRAVFADHAAAVAYLDSSREDVAWDLPPFDGPRAYAGHVTVLTAR